MGSMISSIDNLVVLAYLCMNVAQQQKLIDLLVDMRGGLSHRDFANKSKLGVSYSTIRSWEKGDSLPTFDNLESIAAYKGWSLFQLFSYLGLDISFDQLFAMVLNLDKSERLIMARKLLQSLGTDI
jgi:transcriptional regulator with XRE-family HTH domain